MRDALRHFVAEFIGVFALVFVGGGAIMQANRDASIGLLEIAAAHGLILAVMVTATMRISGHLNPAVTLGFLATRRIEPMMAGLYLLGQISAAVIAAYCLAGLFPDTVGETARLGLPRVSIQISGVQAIFLEGVATFFLVFAVFGTAVDPRAPRVGGFAIGLTVTAAILAIGPLTGAALNPARAFGPAVASLQFEGQMVYWIGPIVGGVIAALIYDLLFLPRGQEPADHGTVRPDPVPHAAPPRSRESGPRRPKH